MRNVEYVEDDIKLSAMSTNATKSHGILQKKMCGYGDPLNTVQMREI